MANDWKSPVQSGSTSPLTPALDWDSNEAFAWQRTGAKKSSIPLHVPTDGDIPSLLLRRKSPSPPVAPSPPQLSPETGISARLTENEPPICGATSGKLTASEPPICEATSGKLTASEPPICEANSGRLAASEPPSCEATSGNVTEREPPICEATSGRLAATEPPSCGATSALCPHGPPAPKGDSTISCSPLHPSVVSTIPPAGESPTISAITDRKDGPPTPKAHPPVASASPLRTTLEEPGLAEDTHSASAALLGTETVANATTKATTTATANVTTNGTGNGTGNTTLGAPSATEASRIWASLGAALFTAAGTSAQLSSISATEVQSTRSPETVVAIPAHPSQSGASPTLAPPELGPQSVESPALAMAIVPNVGAPPLSGQAEKALGSEALKGVAPDTNEGSNRSFDDEPLENPPLLALPPPVFSLNRGPHESPGPNPPLDPPLVRVPKVHLPRHPPELQPKPLGWQDIATGDSALPPPAGTDGGPINPLTLLNNSLDHAPSTIAERPPSPRTWTSTGPIPPRSPTIQSNEASMSHSPTKRGTESDHSLGERELGSFGRATGRERPNCMPPSGTSTHAHADMKHSPFALPNSVSMPLFRVPTVSGAPVPPPPADRTTDIVLPDPSSLPSEGEKVSESELRTRWPLAPSPPRAIGSLQSSSSLGRVPERDPPICGSHFGRGRNACHCASRRSRIRLHRLFLLHSADARRLRRAFFLDGIALPPYLKMSPRPSQATATRSDSKRACASSADPGCGLSELPVQVGGPPSGSLFGLGMVAGRDTPTSIASSGNLSDWQPLSPSEHFRAWNSPSISAPTAIPRGTGPTPILRPIAFPPTTNEDSPSFCDTKETTETEHTSFALQDDEPILPPDDYPLPILPSRPRFGCTGSTLFSALFITILLGLALVSLTEGRPEALLFVLLLSHLAIVGSIQHPLTRTIVGSIILGLVSRLAFPTLPIGSLLHSLFSSFFP
jgi:hypothetical protein